MFSNLTQCSRNKLSLKCIYFGRMLALIAQGIIHFWPSDNIRYQPERVPNSLHTLYTKTTRTAAEQMLGSRRPRVTLSSGAEVAPKRKQPMAAFDINSPRDGAPQKLGSRDMCFHLAFSPVLCATDLCGVLVHLLVSMRSWA